MRGLGSRLRKALPSIFEGPYFPARHEFVSTQVPRTSASAVAFAQGLFPGANGAAKPISLTMSPRHADPLLRFFDMCPRYAAHKNQIKAALVRGRGRGGVVLLQCVDAQSATSF